jgi:hypothetical protein
MSVALNKEYNSPLRTLISADMAAARGKISKESVIPPDTIGLLSRR